MADETVLSKTGPELFRELLRIYSVAEVEDYYKAGVWRNEQMKADLQLIQAHRREAGAPDPPDLEDVPMPELPKAPVASPLLPVSAVQGIKPVAVPSVLAAATLRRPPTPLSTNQAAAPVVVTPMSEFQLVEAFVKKWQLEPSRAKMVLANLPQLRRRFVIQNFKTETVGAAATNALVQFVAQCEKAAPAAGVVRPAMVTVAAPTAGVVRPPMAKMAAPVAGVVRPPTVKMAAPAAGVVRPAMVKMAAPAAGVVVRPAMVKMAAPAAGVVRPGMVTMAAAGAKRPFTPLAQAVPVPDTNKRPRLGMPTTVLAPVKQLVAVAKPPVTVAKPGVIRPPGRSIQPVRAQIPAFTNTIKPTKPDGSLIRSLLQKL